MRLSLFSLKYCILRQLLDFVCCGMRNNPGLDIIPQTPSNLIIHDYSGISKERGC